METGERHPEQMRERAARHVPKQRSDCESQWASTESVAEKIRYSRETLRRWVRQAERDRGERAGLTADERKRLKELELEHRELRRSNEIPRKTTVLSPMDS